MKINKFLIIGLLIVTFASSCKDSFWVHSVSFTVVNKTNSNIEKSKFFIGSIPSIGNIWNGEILENGDSIEFSKSIAPNDSATFVWNNPKTYSYDECFYVKINNLKGERMGYFSNGNIDKYSDKYSIQVYRDTLICK